MYNNFEISLVVFMPNITTNHAITYTNQGTEKRRNHTNLRLLMWTTGILVSLGSDFLWKFDGCMGVETYFAQTADTQTDITQ